MDKASALYAQYVIGGVPQELTPAEILDAVCDRPLCCLQSEDIIIDEVIDPVMKPCDLDASRIEEYLDLVCKNKKQASPAFARTYSKSRVAQCLTESLWREGHFRIGDLTLAALWDWNQEPVGSFAAFYESAQAVADYVDALGIQLSSYEYRQSDICKLEMTVGLSADIENSDDIFVKEAFRADSPMLGPGRKCPSVLQPDAQSWLIYIPFETCDFRLGGSLLAQSLGFGGGVTPQLGDADYFIDCYEVVRELIEDGVAIAGTSVLDGGLLKAVKEMSAGGTGVKMELLDLIKAYEDSNVVRLLFAEVPGALVQIRDIDFDYLDAELLLQDVAFFPLGHPTPGNPDVRVKASAKSGIQTILESLIQNAEGED